VSATDTDHRGALKNRLNGLLQADYFLRRCSVRGGRRNPLIVRPSLAAFEHYSAPQKFAREIGGRVRIKPR
jgi:hypothetical protein